METIRKNPLTDIIDKVSFVNYSQLLARATADNDESTPGYLLQEVENIAYQPDPCCQQLVDYLAQRLDRPSAVVKIKVLKIMTHMIQNGPRSFRQYLRRKDGSIKMATTFHMTPDPLTGTSRAESVRRLAQELLVQLFDARLLAEDSGATSKSIGGVQSKSSATLGGLGSAGVSKGRYEGFGSSSAAKKESLVDTIRNAMDKWASSHSSSERFIEEALKSDPGDYKPVPRSLLNAAPAVHPEPQPRKAPEKERVHVPGRAGGGWDEAAPLYTPAPAAEERQELEVPVAGSTPEEKNPSPESLLVTNFCTAGPLPCRLADIRTAGQRCLELSTTDILQALSKVLLGELSDASPDAPSAAQADAAVTRAMLLLEWLLRSDALAGSPLPSDTCSPALVQLAEESSERPSAVRLKAEKLLLTMHRLQLISAQQDSACAAQP